MTRDEQLTLELLCGRVTRDEELEARRALARILRTSSPLDPGLRFILADLVDPDCDEVPREIQFKRRHPGQPSTPAIAEKEVAEFIWMRRRDGEAMKAAVFAATERFGISRSRVQAIWKEWRPILTRIKRTDLDGHPLNPT